MQGDKPVAALLRAKVNVDDNMSMKLTVGSKPGFMILSEFENELGTMTAKVYPRESAAKASSSGQEIIKVNVVRDFT